MKRRNAFAFANFDGNRVLQRQYFKKFGFADKPDAKILAALSPTDDDDLDVLKIKAKTLSDLYDAVKDYQEHVAHHVRRLNAFARAVADKIATDVNADVPALRDLHKRAVELAERYTNIINGDAISTLAAIAGGVNACGLLSPIAATYKKVADAMKLFYRRRFAERLKSARKSAGLKQAELADKVDVSRRTFAGYELAEREPTIMTVVQLADFFGVTVDWLFGIDR